LKGKIERKVNLAKEPKTLKEWGSKLTLKIKKKCLIEG
jgi:hypothetical protein